MNITKEDWLRYKEVQESGKYNMVFYAARMKHYGDDSFMEIIKNYDLYRNKFEGEKDGRLKGNNKDIKTNTGNRKSINKRKK